MDELKRIKIMKKIFVPMFLLALATGISSMAVQADPINVPSKAQVKTLMRNAKTPEQHLQIAAYFRAEADALRANATEHEEMAADYDGNSATRSATRGRTLGQHCRALAEVYNDNARKADKQAALHEEMAKAR
jgi:hypothetical protein